MSNTAVDTTTHSAPHLVGQPLPVALSCPDLMRILGMSRTTFYKEHRAGAFKRFEFRRAVGPRKFSGRLVQAYLDGQGR